MKRKIILRMILIVLAAGFACCAMLTPETAYAWKTKTHGYSANILLGEIGLQDDTIEIGTETYTMPEEYHTALIHFPDAFRAGVLGPDFYPDMLTGQSYIHPYDLDAGKGVGDWLKLLEERVNALPQYSPQRLEALAFTLGMACHYAGDMFGHDFINAFAGGAYPAYADAMQDTDKLYYIIRHMAQETYMDKQIGDRLGDTGVSAPEQFILESWIYNGTPNGGPAKIYDSYSGGMMYQFKYLVELRETLYNYAESKRDAITPPMPQIVAYVDHWIEDLDIATEQLIIAFDDIAQEFLANDGTKGDVSIVTDRLMKWLHDYGAYASPTPDWLTDIAHAMSAAKDAVLKALGLESLLEKYEQFKKNLISDALKWLLNDVVGIDTDMLKDPHSALTANGGTEEDYTEFITYMNRFASSDPEDFEAFYNTLLMAKLILIGPDNQNAFFAKYNAALPDSEKFKGATGAVMMDGFNIKIRTKDAAYCGTDDNVFIDVYEGNKRICSKLLDKSQYDDFEHGDHDTYYVELPHMISPSDLKFSLRIEKISKLEADEDTWTVDRIDITPLNGKTEISGSVNVLSGDNKFETWGQKKDYNPNLSSTTYNTDVNLSIIDFMWSNDNSTQWVNSKNKLWTRSDARRNILYEVFKGFKPTFDLTVTNANEKQQGLMTPIGMVYLTVYTIHEGDSAELTGTLHSYWNGITKERRDREYLISEVNETAQQACTGEVKIHIIPMKDGEQEQIQTVYAVNGQFNINLSNLAAGTIHYLSAEYGGDSYNGTAQSNAMLLEVIAATDDEKCTISLTADPTDGGTVSGGGKVIKEKTAIVSAMPNAGYEFVNWTENDAVVSTDSTYSFTATADRNLTAHFQKKMCTIKFVDSDGRTVLGGPKQYEYGTPAAGIDIIPSDPQKQSDAFFAYTFTGWTPAVADVTRSQTYKATYSRSMGGCTIKFVDEDGTVLQTSVVTRGRMPRYTEELPTKAPIPHYTFAFDGWNPTIVVAAGDATYTATYKKVGEPITITFVDEDGTVLDTADYEYGTAAEDIVKPADPTKPATAQYTYTFAGWSPALAQVTQNQTYTATYSDSVNSYTIRFVNEDGKELQSSAVKYGETPVYTGDTPVKASDGDYTYTFSGWTPEIAPVTGPVDYKAVFTAITSYAFTEGDGSEWTKGSDVPLNAVIKGSPDDSNTYTNFTGIQTDGSTVSAGNYDYSKGSVKLALKASYLETLPVGKHTLTAVFKDGKAEMSFTIKASAATPTVAPTSTPKPTKVPRTGDGANLPLWFGLILLGLIGLCGLVVVRNRK